ncbi:hypothetical protein LTS15_004048 [Exophiala xenobiotica]|nr:hypothetical protein LTS15_004048 [Exophiala xenobiotica]
MLERIRRLRNAKRSSPEAKVKSKGADSQEAVVLPNPQPCIYTSIKSKSLDNSQELHNGTDNTEDHGQHRNTEATNILPLEDSSAALPLGTAHRHDAQFDDIPLLRHGPGIGSISRPKSYWGAALHRLELKSPDVFGAFERLQQDLPDGDLPEALLAVIQKHRQVMEQREWSLPFKVRGRSVKLRRQLDTIARALLGFKGLGAAVSRLDLMQIAPAAWGCLTFILQVALNDSEQHAAAIEGASEIAPIISRYTILEFLYLRDQDCSLKTIFEESIIDLYTIILQYQTNLAIYFQRHAFTRLLRSVPSLDDFPVLLKKIKSQDEVCKCFTSIFDEVSALNRHQEVQTFFQQIDQRLERAQEELDALSRTAKMQRNTDILRWLSSVSVLAYHQTILEDFKMGTAYVHAGQWLRQHPDFVRWQDCSVSSHAMFWLHGSIGTGKTSITSRVIEWYLEDSLGRDGHRTAFYYCSKTQGNQQGTVTKVLFCALLQQLAWSRDGTSITPALEAEFERSRCIPAASDALSRDKCMELLEDAISSLEKAFVVVDGLDECDDSIEVATMLEELVDAVGPKLRIFLTSRDEGPLRDTILDCHKVPMRSQNTRGDLQYFVRHEVFDRKRRLFGGSRADVEEEIVEIVSRKAEGMFRWAELQLAIIFDKRTPYRIPEDVQAKLAALDRETAVPSLRDAYDEVYNINTKADRTDRQHAIKAYRMLLCCRRPLRTEELTEAVATNPDGTVHPLVDSVYVLEITRNLVFEDERSQTVRFSHQSVVEYLKGRGSKKTREFDQVQNNSQMAEACLLATPREMNEKLGFYEYAREWWLMHTDMAESGLSDIGKLIFSREDSDIDQLNRLSIFNQACPRRPMPKSQRQSGRHSQTLSHGQSTLLAVMFEAAFAAQQRIMHWESLGHGVVYRPDPGDTVLHCAVAMPDTQLLLALLTHGSQIFLNTRNVKGETPLHRAITKGTVRTIRILLDAGASPFCRDNTGETLIHAATRARKVPLVDSLIVDIELPSLHLTTPSQLMQGQAACQSPSLTYQVPEIGHQDCVDRSSSRNADVEVFSPEVCKIQMFISRGVDLHSEDIFGNTALHVAAGTSRWFDMHSYLERQNLSYLLRINADVNAQNKQGWTPLHIACTRGFVYDAILMLNRHPNLELATRTGWTALHLAAFFGRAHIARMLLQKGSRVDARTNAGWCALHLAAVNGHYQIVAELLSCGADAFGTGPSNWTPRALALHFGHSYVLHILRQVNGCRESAASNAVTPVPGPLIKPFPENEPWLFPFAESQGRCYDVHHPLLAFGYRDNSWLYQQSRLLPPAWEVHLSDNNDCYRPYFINHTTRKTSFNDPRGEFYQAFEISGKDVVPWPYTLSTC